MTSAENTVKENVFIVLTSFISLMFTGNTHTGLAHFVDVNTACFETAYFGKKKDLAESHF